MAEQTFKSPGFFEREIEVISRPLTRNTATPVGVIGPAQKGQAFVPKTVTSVDEFIREFGMPDQDTSAAHAVSEFFTNGGKAATFCRILGSGKSAAAGTNNYAGFKIDGTALTAGGETDRARGAVQFIVAEHEINLAEHVTYGIFNDNDSHKTSMDPDPSDNGGALQDVNSSDREVQLVRAMIFMHKDYTLRISEASDTTVGQSSGTNDTATPASGLFKLWIMKHDDDTDADPYTVSLDPSSTQYIAKVLNTDPYSFTKEKHFLYADFPVDSEIAEVKDVADRVGVVRGNSENIDLYGDFVSRFTAPQTTSFISQPFGKKEYDLFHFESLDDGAYASGSYKISIANIKASTQKNYKYGTFSVQLRKIDDTDEAPVILESYSRCSLDPDAKNYIARLIGDQKVMLSLDVDSEDEKRLVREGTFQSKSSRIRVVMSKDVMRGEAPDDALPFGFRGIPALKTTSDGKDANATTVNSLLLGKVVDSSSVLNALGSSILPPLPFRSKVTKGSMLNNAGAYFQEYFGQALNKETGLKTSQENVKTSLYWGLHTSRVSNIDRPNDSLSTDFNPLIRSLTKFLAKRDEVKFSGTAADKFNNNKFSLAKVAFPGSTVASIQGSPLDAFLEAVYVRNADVDSAFYDAVNHTIDMDADSSANDPFIGELSTVASNALIVGTTYEILTTPDNTAAGISNNVVGEIFTATLTSTGDANGTMRPFRNTRATMAKLLAEDITKFNKYSQMAKFTAPFYGGFDGVNILNRDDAFFTDRATSVDLGGHAGDGGYTSGLDGTDDADPMQGKELNNNAVISYRNAILVMTDEMIIDHNVLVVPGIRESLISDYAARRVRDYGKAIYLMDIPHYTKDNERIFVSSRGIATGTADVDLTSSIFDQRELDSSYVATYFPDVMIKDSGDDENARQTNHRAKRVPSSAVALGALARTDANQSPWFAPAGFSRGALPNVTSLDVRLNAADRDTLYEARINPIANFPNNQFVIFGQKTTQIARTALDRVNVRRLMINIKRRIQKVAQGLLFEQNDAATRNRFISRTSSILADVRVRQGIEDFRVIMDDTNNSAEDVDNNRLNGRIVVVPTRAVEFIAMDFVITNSGVEFP
jgi:hypothetical protein